MGPKPKQKAIKLADLDLDKIKSDLAALEPPRISYEEAVEKISKEIRAQTRRGITPSQVRAVLKKNGIDISERALNEILAGGTPQRGKGAATGVKTAQAHGNQDASPARQDSF